MVIPVNISIKYLEKLLEFVKYTFSTKRLIQLSLKLQ